uniref:Uncharacterized protein n=2 Tax=Helianthus annuus TaxID=4232 RepID=A0A251T7Q8_HELAN
MYLMWSLFSNRRLDFDSDSDEGGFEDVEDEVSPKMTDCYIAVPTIAKEVHPFADEVDAMMQMKVLLVIMLFQTKLLLFLLWKLSHLDVHTIHHLKVIRSHGYIFLDYIYIVTYLYSFSGMLKLFTLSFVSYLFL